MVQGWAMAAVNGGGTGRRRQWRWIGKELNLCSAAVSSQLRGRARGGCVGARSSRAKGSAESALDSLVHCHWFLID